MNRLLLFLRQHFAFSTGEARGFIILLIVLSGIISAPIIYRHVQADLPEVTAAEVRLLDSLTQVLDSKLKPRPVEYVAFNPNTADQEQLQALGLKKYIARRVINYRNKVGPFTIKSDLKKIYGLEDSTYRKLEPYIQLPEKTLHYTSRKSTGKSDKKKNIRPVAKVKSPIRKAKETTPPLRFDLNTADSLQLQSIRGIGPVLAGRIVKFRDKLGGFVNKQQLSEVYGLKSEVVEQLKQKTKLQQAFAPRQIDLNSATFKELLAHPYLTYQQTKLIVAYRDQHRPIEKLSELEKIPLIDSVLLQKIEPYIKITKK